MRATLLSQEDIINCGQAAAQEGGQGHGAAAVQGHRQHPLGEVG